MANVYRLEAEDLKLRYGFSVQKDYGAGASNDTYISLPWHTAGRATGIFDGDAGLYEVRIGYFDETDGSSVVNLWVDGVRENFRLNKKLGDDEPAPDTHAETVTHESINLEKGDKLSLHVRAIGKELAAIDYIELREIVPDEPVPDPPDDPQPDDGDSGYGAFEEEVIRLTNQLRSQHGLAKLAVNDKLNAAAEGHSDDMARLDFFSHFGKDGSEPDDRLKSEGYDPELWEENIGAGFDTPQQMVNAWYNNWRLREHMLDKDVTDIGAGFVQQIPDTGKVNYKEYWTLVVAKEADGSPPPDDPEPDQPDDPQPQPDPEPEPEPQPEPDTGSDGFGFFEQEVMRLTNQIRAQHGLSKLTGDDQLHRAAEGHSDDMARLNFFSHTGKDGSSAGDRIEDEGYSWRTWGENIAAGQNTPEQVVNVWYNSPGHRANMLNERFEEIGVGFVEDDDGVGYGEYWTQVFAA